MAPLLWWGLPSAREDALLFGGNPPWKAEQYHLAPDLEHLRARPAGADTDLNPLPARDRIVELTADQDARAEILRRYRLFSRQPDEMIVFRALQRMNPRRLDFDPQLYQYGGGYIYLIGAALAGAARLGLVRVSGDAALYLEHPDAFARFYVVARVVSLVFGALTLAAVNKLARRAGGRLAGWLAMLCVACAPVFITAVLEVKPHLPSACLILWAILSALNYRTRGRTRDVVRMGLQAGYAFGLVLTGLASAALWPAAWWGRAKEAREHARRGLLIAAGLAIAVYLVTNPYIPYDWVARRAVLVSNISNSTAMYRDQARQAPAGAVRVGELLVESMGLGGVAAGVAGLCLLWRRHGRETTIAAVAGVATLALGALLGAGKPAEFARFLILPVLLLCVACGWLLAALTRRHVALGLVAIVAVLLTMRTPAYLHAFAVDAWARNESRVVAGRYLAKQVPAADAIGLLQEPAPYAVPPLDFTRRRVVLLPAAAPRDLDPAQLPQWLVFTADAEATRAGAWWQEYYRLEVRFPPESTPRSPICWADKPVFVYRRVR